MTCSDSSLHQVVFLDAGTLPSGLPFAPAQRALIDYRAHDTTAPSEVAERVADACIVIVNKVKLGEAEMAAAPSLRRICVSAAGTDNIDLQAAAARQISVFNVPDYGSEAVAEHAIASFATAAAITLHISLVRGRNVHHIIEATFKGLARCLRDAVRVESTGVPSTKGSL